MKITNLDEVWTYLEAVPVDAPEVVKWRTLRTATRRLLRSMGVTEMWNISPLPSQATKRYGDCTYHLNRIRYRREHVAQWCTGTLASTIVHEVAHAVNYTEMKQMRLRGGGGHSTRWRGVAATMGLRGAQAYNLPTPH